jgi:hypothetical protein
VSLLFLPQYGRLAAIFSLLASNLARVSEMHVAIMSRFHVVGYRFIGTMKQKATKQNHATRFFTSYLRSIVSVVAKGESVLC